MKKWTEEKILIELKVLEQKNKCFPTAKYLQSIRKWGLFRAIAKHGGFTYFRKLLNYNITPHGYWKDNYKPTIESMVKKLGRFPTTKELRNESEGLENHYIEVWGYKSNYYEEKRKIKEKLYKSLGFNLISLELTLFQKPYKEIKEGLNKIFLEYGFNIAKKQADYKIEDIVSRGKNYWTFENTLKELKTITKNQIQKSMQNYGGQNPFKKILGFPILNGKGR